MDNKLVKEKPEAMEPVNKGPKKNKGKSRGHGASQQVKEKPEAMEPVNKWRKKPEAMGPVNNGPKASEGKPREHEDSQEAAHNWWTRPSLREENEKRNPLRVVGLPLDVYHPVH